MPKGSKTCSSCGTITGPRSFTCPKCKTPFKMATRSALAAKAGKKKVKKTRRGKKSPSASSDVDVPTNYVPSKLTTIAIPAGECPVKLKGLTEEDVIQWAKAVRASCRPGARYAGTALEYWLRQLIDDEDVFDELIWALYVD